MDNKYIFDRTVNNAIRDSGRITESFLISAVMVSKTKAEKETKECVNAEYWLDRFAANNGHESRVADELREFVQEHYTSSAKAHLIRTLEKL